MMRCGASNRETVSVAYIHHQSCSFIVTSTPSSPCRLVLTCPSQIVTLLAPRLVPGKDSMSGVPGQSAIMQLLRLSFGHKEVNAEYVDQMVSWFNTHR